MIKKSRERRGQVVDSMGESGHGRSHLKSKLNLNVEKENIPTKVRNRARWPLLSKSILTYGHTHTEECYATIKKEKGRYL